MSQTQPAFAYFNHAAHLYQQVSYAEAIKYYLAGLEIDPMCVEAYADLAKTYEKLGCWDQAIESLEIALQRRPGYPTALRRKQRILEEKSIYDSLTDELNIVLNAPDRGQLTNAAQEGSSKIEHEFFTLTGGTTIPQELLAVCSQIVEHTYHKVGVVFQCYPQHKVPVFIETTSKINIAQTAQPGRSTTSPIQVTNHTLFSDADLPVWAVACYEDGGIRLTYHPYSSFNPAVLYAVVRHEWTHLLVDLLTAGRCPNWFDEGLAQFVARPLMNSEKARIRQAGRDKQLLPFRLLQKPFSQLPEKQRRLAYLQSYAIVKYLIQRFSFDALREVLKQFGDGEPINAAFQAVFGKTEEEIIVASNAEHCKIV